MFRRVILCIIKNVKSKSMVDMAVSYLKNKERFRDGKCDKSLEKVVRNSTIKEIKLAALNMIKNSEILASFVKDGILEENALKKIDSLNVIKNLYYDEGLENKYIHLDIKFKYIDLLRIYANAINNTEEQIKFYKSELEKLEGFRPLSDNKQKLSLEEYEVNRDEGCNI